MVLAFWDLDPPSCASFSLFPFSFREKGNILLNFFFYLDRYATLHESLKLSHMVLYSVCCTDLCKVFHAKIIPCYKSSNF